MNKYVLAHLNTIEQVNRSFKTRTGPMGRPGTRPTRAWDRSGWRQKPAWELARRNPTRDLVHPVNFFFNLTVIKRRRFGLLKGQNAED
jgi:hypothetical protein